MFIQEYFHYLSVKRVYQLIRVNKNSVKKSIMDFPEKNCTPPVKNIDFFEVDPPEFPVKFNVIPLEFSIFLSWPPWKSMFFPQLLVCPHGIPTTFTLPMEWEFSIDIFNRGVTTFFWKNPIIESLAIGFIVVRSLRRSEWFFTVCQLINQL